MSPQNKLLFLNKECSNIESLYDYKILLLKKECSELIYTYKDTYEDLLKEYFRDIFNSNKEINNIKFSIYRDWSNNDNFFSNFIINDGEINDEDINILKYVELTNNIEIVILEFPKEILDEYNNKDIDVYIKDNEIIIEFNECKR